MLLKNFPKTLSKEFRKQFIKIFRKNTYIEWIEEGISKRYAQKLKKGIVKEISQRNSRKKSLKKISIFATTWPRKSRKEFRNKFLYELPKE